MHGKGTITKEDGRVFEYVHNKGVLVSTSAPSADDDISILGMISDSRVLVPLMAITAGILFYFFLSQNDGMMGSLFSGPHKHVMCVRNRDKAGCVQSTHGFPPARHRYADGPGSTGDFASDETVVFSNGDTYSGDWKDGKIHGEGTYRWSNRDQYAGMWKMGKMHGQG